MSSQDSPTIRKPRLERVVSCSGPTPRARLAQEIAARLRALEDGPAGDDCVVVIDGCSSACASSRLEVRGIHTAAVALDRLGADLDEGALEPLLARVVDELAGSAACGPVTPVSQRRQRRPAAAGAPARKAHSTDDYLFAVYGLTSPVVPCGAVASDLPTLASHVASTLSISRAAAGEMLARLERDGLIERGPGKELLLTGRGRAASERVVRRHRIVERFLTDVLDYSVADSHDLALRIRDGFDEDVVERLATLLAPVCSCPHGWPFDPAEEALSLAGLAALSALEVGTPATIMAFAGHDAPRLAALSGLGMSLGAAVEVVRRCSGAQLVASDGRERWLDDAAADAVLVRLADQQ